MSIDSQEWQTQAEAEAVQALSDEMDSAMVAIVDIRSGCGYPGTALSNFAPHRFVFDGVECASMEGLLQSLKFDEGLIQIEVCKLVGREAKFRGKARNNAWKQAQALWWRGKEMKRSGDAYQRFLDRAFQSMFDQSEPFRDALRATQDAVVTHSMGKSDEADTVLTEQEFCSRLMTLRRFSS